MPSSTPKRSPGFGVRSSDRILGDLERVFGSPTADTEAEWLATSKVSNDPTFYEFQYSVFWSMGMVSLFDRTWLRYMRIAQAGDNYSRDYADPARVVEFRDVGTGLVWQAYTYDPVKRVDGSDVDPSIGADYLSYVNSELATLAPGPERDFFLDLVRERLDFLYNLQYL